MDSESTLQTIVGSAVRAKVLLHLCEYGEGYARQMAARFECSLDAVQKQLHQLEAGGVILSRRLGRLRLYRLNPEHEVFQELAVLLDRALRLRASRAEKSWAVGPEPGRAGEQNRFVLVRRFED